MIMNYQSIIDTICELIYRRSSDYNIFIDKEIET